jgi:hypothetical protein
MDLRDTVSPPPIMKGYHQHANVRCLCLVPYYSFMKLVRSQDPVFLSVEILRNPLPVYRIPIFFFSLIIIFFSY